MGESVVVVDDDPEIVSLLTKTLKPHFRVFGATSGVEALGLVGSQDVVAVVTDQKMPGMTGVQLARAVHREDAQLSVVLLTAYTDPADVIAAINEGEVFRYVTKPWNVSDLVVTVKSAAERTRLSRENQRLVSALNRQISAISLVSSVGRDVGVSGTTLDVFSHLLKRLPGVVDFDLGAALVEELDGDAARRTLHIECAAGMGEDALLHARDRMTELFDLTFGQRARNTELVVRVSGAKEQQNVTPLDSLSEIHVTVAADGRQLGIIALWTSARPGYSHEDTRLLDVLASETAGLLRQQQEALEEEKRYFDALMSSLADGVIVARLDGSIASVNAAARGFLGIFPDAPLDEVWSLLGFSPRVALAAFETKGPAPVRFAAQILGRRIEGIASPVFDSKRRLQEVAFTLREEHDGERAKDELIATLSHELKNPLVSLNGALDLALQDPAGEDVRRYVSTALEASGRLSVLLDDILDLAKQRSGELAVRLTQTDLAPVVQSSVQSLSAAAERAGLHLQVSCDALPCNADGLRVQQVLANLLGNALKFARKGSHIAVTARVSSTRPAFVYVLVHNEGPVIPKHEHARIFRRFEQGSTAALAQQRGSGLGLAISASLVQAHAGFIWVDSEEGRGTTFGFAIPCEPMDPLPQLDPQRLLVVDDDTSLSQFLRGLFGHLGLDVETASGGEQALSLARRIPFDAIITDVRMSDVDGLTLTETLRHDPATRHIPVIVFSVMEQADAARRAGAWAFVPKPMPVATVIDKLREQKKRNDSPVVAVIDPDAATRSMVAQVLSNLGSRVLEGERFADAERFLNERRVDVLLMNCVLPDGDALALFEKRRVGDSITLFLSDQGEASQKVRAFRAGGDDYLVKPIDALELAARVDSALRRREREVTASPTTRLPGSLAIEREVQHRIQSHEGFVLCYFDIDHLKAFNDYYGYAKTDAVIQQTGDILREVVARSGSGQDFIGHVAGDDFVCVFTQSNAEALCQQVIDAFDKIIPLYYDTDDRKRGFIETEDRFGHRREFPIMSISVAAIVIPSNTQQSYADLSAEAADVKKRAKAIPGSSMVIEKRREAIS